MIITVTLNPAIDRTLQVPRFVPGQVNRALHSRTDVGGKGINVSKAVLALGGETLATGFMGGKDGRLIKDSLNAMGMHHDFVEVPGHLRVNIKIVACDGSHTDVNEAGFSVTEEDCDRLRRRLFTYVSPDRLMVLSGRPPSGVAPERIGDLCRVLADKGAPLIVDIDGPFLTEALTARPILVKPNADELASVTGRAITTPEEAVAGAKELLSGGAGAVVVSMGPSGAVYCTPETAYWAKARPVHAIGPVGAGDAMVAALAMGMIEHMSPGELIRFAVAMGTASSMVEGSRMATRMDMLRVFQQTTVKQIG